MVICQLEICQKDLQVLMNCGNNEIHRQHSETVHVELMKDGFWWGKWMRNTWKYMEMPFDFKSSGLVKDDSHCRRLLKMKKVYLCIDVC